MTRRSALSMALGLALLNACAPAHIAPQPPATTGPSFMPSTAASATPTPMGSLGPTTSASVKPTSASYPSPSPTCGTPVAVDGGGTPYVLDLAGYAAVNGLNVQGTGASATVSEPTATIRLAAHPGSGNVTVSAVNVGFEVNGTATNAQRVVLGAPVTLTGSATAYGPTQDVTFTLPANALQGQLGADPSKAEVKAVVQFLDDKGMTVLDENFNALGVVLMLNTGTATTPAYTRTLTMCQ